MTIVVTPENHPPVADPDGPYTGYTNTSVTVNGTGSYDPDTGDHIVSYGWELDGIPPYDFDDANTPIAEWIWTAKGTYNIGLKVTDSHGLNGTAWTTVTILPNIPPVLEITEPDDNETIRGSININRCSSHTI